MRPMLMMLLSVLLVSCGSDAPEAGKPAGTEWVAIAHDPGITIRHSDSIDLPFVDYDVDAAVITVKKHFGAVIAWKDGTATVMVAYSPLSSGAMLVRVDTTTKTVVYDLRLIGIGGVDHSQYHNEVRIFANRDLIKVVGEETAGRYEELRRSADGSLVHVSQTFAPFDQPKTVRVR